VPPDSGPRSARTFVVADLSAGGELQFKADYRYEDLEQIPGATELIAHFSTFVWRNPEGFEGPLPTGHPRLTFRWRPSSPTAGLATLRCLGELTSLSLLVSGITEGTDAVTLGAFQQHLLRELRDTGFEPAFALMDLKERPLAATINFDSPDDPSDRGIAALADRCFAASYFRYQGLA
jgi:hypothetical protein